ncbi:MAG: hypothetical protein IMZ69_03300 [Spirochaetes bacterium]|nr:hypothetical protein [Spirochaetota bacterium]
MSFAHPPSNAAYRLMVWEYALQDLLIPRYDALDMFHAVRDPAAWLRVIHRIVKSNGRLILEDGHQSRASTVAKERTPIVGVKPGSRRTFGGATW